jgi:hypothetical protein
VIDTTPPVVTMTAPALGAAVTATVTALTCSPSSVNSQGSATCTVPLTTGTASTSAAQLGTLTCSPATLSAGQTASCTIGLLSPAAGSSAVTTQASSSIVTAPANVAASAGQTSIGFQVVSEVPATQQRVIVTASAGTQSVRTSITIQAGNTPTVDAPPLRTVTAATPMQFKVTHSAPNRLATTSGCASDGENWRERNRALVMGGGGC